MCFSLGTGTLGVPFAVMQGGYLSLAAIIVIALIANYTGKLIIDCLYERPSSGTGVRGVRLRNSYALIGDNCYSYRGLSTVKATVVNVGYHRPFR